jgi:hypothetical protein
MSSNSASSTQSMKVLELADAFEELTPGLWFIRVPKFQRSLVWSEEQKLGLIDSLFRGYPIGILLAYKTGESVGSKGVIQLVDGLQRVTAMLDYLKAPLALAPTDMLFGDAQIKTLASLVFQSNQKSDEEAVTARVRSWLRKTKGTSLSANFQPLSFITHLAAGDGQAQARLIAENDQINSWLDEVKQLVDGVSHLSIPLSLFSGDASEIPTIFERVNTQGAELSKYEILASTWVSSVTVLKNPSVRLEIESRFKVLLDKGYEIAGVDANGRVDEAELNLFDYLSGLGAHAQNLAPQLFGQPSHAGATSPVAFVASCVAHGLKSSNMKNLPTVFSRNKFGAIDPSAFENAFLISIQAVAQALSPFLSIRLNQRQETSESPLHSQNQIIALVLGYMLARFEPKSFADKSHQSGENVLSAIPGHYIFDSISSHWRGSGDSRLFETIWADGGVQVSSYYSQPVTSSQLSDALNTWNKDQMEKKLKVRSSYPAAAKLFLKFAYSGTVSVLQDKKTLFEIEHIYPVARLSAAIPKSDEGWPISAPGNLMLLPKQINRIKGKNLLGETIPLLQKTKKLSAKELVEIQNSYLIEPQWSSVTMHSKFSKKEYEDFLNLRFAAIRDLVLANLGLLP